MYNYSSSDEDYGFSDDNDYEDFQARMKNQQKQPTERVDTEAEQKKRQLKTIFSAILAQGKHETVFEELDKGLDVDVDLELGWTPLLLASTIANETIIRGLVERGASLEQTRDSIPPLMLLCNISVNDEDTENKILSCVKLFLEKQVDLNVCDKRRRTAIMLAATNGHFEVVKLLLPLVDKEAEDNQKWTVLFWAVDGNQVQIVQYLLHAGCNYEKTDIRGETPMELAKANDFYDVLNLFPADPFDEFYSHMTNNDNMNFEDIFQSLEKNEKPKFFSDICKILYGTRSEHVMPAVLENNLTLGEFLSINNAKLEDLGVKFPYQRNRILGGIYQFHKRPFKPQSIPFIKKDQLYSTIDVATAVLTCIKQLIAMEAGLKFMVENGSQKLSLSESEEISIVIAKIRQQIDRLKKITGKLATKTTNWDLSLKSADRITKKRRNIPWCNLCLAVGVGSLIIWYKFK